MPHLLGRLPSEELSPPTSLPWAGFSLGLKSAFTSAKPGMGWRLELGGFNLISILTCCTVRSVRICLKATDTIFSLPTARVVLFGYAVGVLPPQPV